MAEYNMDFSAEPYTVETKKVEGPGLGNTVTYRHYHAVTYCANPVDPDYQGMDVLVPIQVDGKDIDVSDAPILIDNLLGAYKATNIKIRGFGSESPIGGLGGHGPGGPGGPGGHGMPKDGDHEKLYTARSVRQLYCLSRGLVVIIPGARGRENVDENGKYFGKAPAQIVDLKAAVRYIRHNKNVFPGNTDKIFSNGLSAGGAMSALLGASANYPDFEPYLDAIGAAKESDSVLGTLCHCPIMDLDHADAAYEWMYGSYPCADGELVDQEKSKELAQIYADYVGDLNLEGRNGFGTLTADNLGEYIVKEFMTVSADKYLKEELNDEERAEYLEKNPWISWDGEHSSFTFADLTAHAGRMKKMSTFDGDPEGEMSLFGNEDIDARHYTEFGARIDDPNGTVEPEVKHLADLMNPMFFVKNDNPDCSRHWYITAGSMDHHTAHSITTLFNTLLENKGIESNLFYQWDYGHRCDDDMVGMVDWIYMIADQK